MFGNMNILIPGLSWDFIKSNFVFLSHAGTNLQKIKMLKSNFTKIKNKVIFYRKIISQNFWYNYPFFISQNIILISNLIILNVST